MRAGGAPNLFWKSADGSGSAERLTTSEYAQQPYSWSSDGTLLFFQQSRDPDTGWDIWMLPFVEDGKAGSPEPFLKTPSDELQPALSPDGRWIAYVSNASGRNEIYVTAFPGPGAKLMISTHGGVHPVWAPTGRELFYRHEDRMMVTDIDTQPELHPGIPWLLFEGSYQPEQIFGRNYDVSSDGQRFVMLKRPEESALHQINVVLNWFEELKRLVPTKF
jgi:Tol biopolymer transport system component